MAASAIPVICYNFTDVSRFWRSVALPVALQKHTRTEWVRYRESAVINALYGAMFWKTPPGTVEVREGDAALLEETANRLQHHYLLVWLAKLHQSGPQAAADYVAHMAELRDDVRDDLDKVFSEAAALNRDIADATGDAIRTLARIKLGATVGVAAMGATGTLVLSGTAAMITSGTSAGYSMSCALIKAYERGPKAAVAGVSIEAGKATASELLGWVAERSHVNALAREARATQIVSSAEGVVRQQSARIAQLAAARASKRVARKVAASTRVLGTAQRQVVTQQAAAQSARTAATAAMVARRSVPIVFAAWDVWEGISDYNEAVGAH